MVPRFLHRGGAEGPKLVDLPFLTTLPKENAYHDIARRGLKRHLFRDLYHHSLSIRWPVFFWLATMIYVSLNVFFGLLYFLIPHSVTNIGPLDFADDFFFSVQTFSTVGYGNFSPVGFLANSVVSVEEFTGLVVNALTTGIVLARFSRFDAHVMFSETAVISHNDDRSVLMARIANLRRTLILSASVEMVLARLITNEQGHSVLHLEKLPLLQPQLPFFRINLPVVHAIDENSPLYGLDPATLLEQKAEIIITMNGTDEISLQNLFAYHRYKADRLQNGYLFKEIIRQESDGSLTADFTLFNVTEPQAQQQTFRPES